MLSLGKKLNVFKFAISGLRFYGNVDKGKCGGGGCGGGGGGGGRKTSHKKDPLEEREKAVKRQEKKMDHKWKESLKCCTDDCREFPMPMDMKCPPQHKARKYQRTWVECPPHDRPRKRYREVPDDCGNRPRLGIKRCVPQQKGLSCDNGPCPKILMPGCAPVFIREAPKCKIYRGPSDCCKPPCPCPSFSECKKKPLPKPCRTECDCWYNKRCPIP